MYSIGHPDWVIADMLIELIKREFKLVCRRPGDILLPVLFLALVMLLFLIISQTGQSATAIQAGNASNDSAWALNLILGIVWITVMLAHILAQEHVFRDDVQDGTAEQWALSPLPLPLLLLIRLFAHWLFTLGPLVLLGPVLALAIGFPTDGLVWLWLTLLIGSPCLHFIGATASSLIASLRGGGAVLALLVLPLWLPVIVFSVNVIHAGIAGTDWLPALALQLSLLMLSLVLAPFAQAMAFRVSLE